MRSLIAISLVLLIGSAYAYTPEQQTALDSMNLGFKLGEAYEKASQGQNVAEYNALVDDYNNWVLLYFGKNSSLFKTKMDEPFKQFVTKPLNASSDLSRFGKKDVYAIRSPYVSDEDVSRQNLENF